MYLLLIPLFKLSMTSLIDTLHFVLPIIQNSLANFNRCLLFVNILQ